VEEATWIENAVGRVGKISIFISGSVLMTMPRWLLSSLILRSLQGWAYRLVQTLKTLISELSAMGGKLPRGLGVRIN
jgi:hypothetical protein